MITEMFKNKKYISGRYAIQKKDNVPVKLGVESRSITEVTGIFRSKALTEDNVFVVVDSRDL